MNQCFLCTVDVYCVQNNMITKPAGSIIRDKIKRWTLVFSLFSVNVCNETTNRTQELTLLCCYARASSSFLEEDIFQKFSFQQICFVAKSFLFIATTLYFDNVKYCYIFIVDDTLLRYQESFF